MGIIAPEPDAMAKAAIIDLKEHFVHVEGTMRSLLPKNREAALAFTHLENASMWATKALCQPRGDT